MILSDPRIPFVIAYLIIDICYVLVSKKTYEDVAKKIQGSGFPPDRMGSAVAAYALLAVGWWFIAAPSVALWIQKGYSPLVAGLIAGSIYGAVVYGVYNLTVRVQFVEYDLGTLFRDLSWGTVSIAFITALYAMYAFGKNRT